MTNRGRASCSDPINRSPSANQRGHVETSGVRAQNSAPRRDIKGGILKPYDSVNGRTARVRERERERERESEKECERERATEIE